MQLLKRLRDCAPLDSYKGPADDRASFLGSPFPSPLAPSTAKGLRRGGWAATGKLKMKSKSRRGAEEPFASNALSRKRAGGHEGRSSRGRRRDFSTRLEESMLGARARARAPGYTRLSVAAVTKPAKRRARAMRALGAQPCIMTGPSLILSVPGCADKHVLCDDNSS